MQLRWIKDLFNNNLKMKLLMLSYKAVQIFCSKVLKELILAPLLLTV